MHNFDEIVDRKHTNSLKHDFAIERKKPADILPLWVADMDFRIANEITQSLFKSVQHSIFGYTDVKESYFEALKNWFLDEFDFEIQSKWVVKTPGVVYAICMAIRALTDFNDAVLIQQPVYYPFADSIIANGRKLVNNALVYQNGKYTIDFIDFENKIVDNKVKLFILCSPHNPVGRVWTKDELIRIGDICLKHNVIVVSDEIHCDFVYEGYKHYVFSTIKPELMNNTIICTSPSKTFNLAGLQVSNIFIANDNIRKKFEKEIKKTGYSQLNTMGLVACESAYKNGRNWLKGLKKYLKENLDFVRNFLNQKLPQIKLVEPQGTYLIWLDFSSLLLTSDELVELIENKAKLWLDNGTMFGFEGNGFMRLNIASPAETIKSALLMLEDALYNKNS